MIPCTLYTVHSTCRGPRPWPRARAGSLRSRRWVPCPPGSSRARGRSFGWSDLLKFTCAVSMKRNIDGVDKVYCPDISPTSELNPSVLYFCARGTRFTICSGFIFGNVKFWHSSLTVTSSLNSLSNQSSSSLSLKKLSLSLMLLFLKSDEVIHHHWNIFPTFCPAGWGSSDWRHQNILAEQLLVSGSTHLTRFGCCASPEHLR